MCTSGNCCIIVCVSLEVQAFHLKHRCRYICHLKRRVNQNDAMTHCCYANAHCFIAKLFHKQFDSNSVSCHFNTTAKRKFQAFYKTISSADADWRLRRDLLHDSPAQICIA